MTDANMQQPNGSDWNYEGAIAEVEEIVTQIESGALPLEAIFTQFEVAVEQLQACDRYLERGREQMELLVETLDDEPEF